MLAHFSRSIKIARKRTHGFLVDLEEQAVFAAEMLEDGTLGDAEGGGDVTDTGGVVSLLGKMAHSGVNNAGPLAFGTRPWRHMAVTRR